MTELQKMRAEGEAAVRRAAIARARAIVATLELGASEAGAIEAGDRAFDRAFYGAPADALEAWMREHGASPEAVEASRADAGPGELEPVREARETAGARYLARLLERSSPYPAPSPAIDPWGRELEADPRMLAHDRGAIRAGDWVDDCSSCRELIFAEPTREYVLKGERGRLVVTGGALWKRGADVLADRGAIGYVREVWAR